MGILVQQDLIITGLLEIGDFSMKSCRVMRIPVKTSMNYGALKDFDDHLKFNLNYMGHKQILRDHKTMRDLYGEECLPSRYIF